MVKIATWNVNSIRARLPNILKWLKANNPDVLLLQEIKTLEESFPKEDIEDLGYNIEINRQKTYNGVAILSKSPIEDTCKALPGDKNDSQARYIEGTVFGAIRVASIYLPNGNPITTEKFQYKLNWMDRLFNKIKLSIESEEIFVFAGDYNVIPKNTDAYNPQNFISDALMQPETRSKFFSIMNLGLTDALRAYNKSPFQYSYWDYQRGSWQKDNGILIDHILLSPQAADILEDSGIDKTPRGEEKASDHVPVWCILDL